MDNIIKKAGGQTALPRSGQNGKIQWHKKAFYICYIGVLYLLFLLSLRTFSVPFGADQNF